MYRFKGRRHVIILDMVVCGSLLLRDMREHSMRSAYIIELSEMSTKISRILK